MTRQQRRSAPLVPIEGEPMFDPVQHAWTVMLSVAESGTLSVTVGRRDNASKRMTFLRLDDVELPKVSGPGLINALCRAVTLIADDPEARLQ